MGGRVTKPQDTMSSMNLMIHAASKQLGQARPPIDHLSLTQIKAETSDKPPRMKLKAAATRHMLPIIEHLLKHFFKPRDEREALRLQTGSTSTTRCTTGVMRLRHHWWRSMLGATLPFLTI